MKEHKSQNLFDMELKQKVLKKTQRFFMLISKINLIPEGLTNRHLFPEIQVQRLSNFVSIQQNMYNYVKYLSIYLVYTKPLRVV